MTTIAVIGAGNIGGTLGRAWALAGHDVCFGVRDATSPKARALLADVGDRTSAASVEEAIFRSQVIVFAIPGPSMDATLQAAGAALDGKILVDTTNRVGAAQMSSVAALKATAPNSSVYRAFNTLGWENFARPVIGGQQVDLFFCGDEGPDQSTIAGLIADVGLNPVYVGGLDQVAVVDNLTALWFALALRRGLGRRLAFKMLTE